MYIIQLLTANNTGNTGTAIPLFFSKLAIFLYSFQSQANIIAIGVVLMIGLSLLSERGRQKIKENFIWILGGIILVFGAINFGAAIGADLTF